jgi:hypothetical protein
MMKWINERTITFAVGGAVTLILLYAQFQYISDKVNPDTITAYRVAEAKRECESAYHRQMDDTRWCALTATTQRDALLCLK